MSLENHCSIPQQRKLVQHLKGILRDKLDLSAVHPGDGRQLPSPLSLKGKILVKVGAEGKGTGEHPGEEEEPGDCGGLA